jgi:hypothetical protein
MTFNGNRSAARMMIIFIFAATLLFSAGVEAKPKKKKAPRKPGTERLIILDAALSLTYDDNIINYSDSDLDLLESDSPGGKFAIESKDDWIIVTRVSPRMSGRLIGDRKGWIDLGFTYYAYAANDVRRYSRISFGARQYLTGRLYGEANYGYIPNYYYRNVFIGQDVLGNDIFQEAKFSKHSMSLEAGYEISKSLDARAAYIFQAKSYNRQFEYRDIELNGFDFGGAWRPLKAIRLWSLYSFERAVAEGADKADSILDVSYDSWDLTIGIRYYSRLFSRLAPEIYGSMQFREIRFQTDKLPDIRRRHIYYFGREDNNIVAKAGIQVNLPYKVNGRVEYAFARKDADLPDIYPDPSLNIPETAEELERKLDYRSNSITLGLTKRF